MMRFVCLTKEDQKIWRRIAHKRWARSQKLRRQLARISRDDDLRDAVKFSLKVKGLI